MLGQCGNRFLHLTHFVRQGDVTLSAEDHTHPFTILKAIPNETPPLPIDHTVIGNDEDDYEDHEKEHHDWLEGHPAIKFLLAGGVAGAGGYHNRSLFAKTHIFCSISDMHRAL